MQLSATETALLGAVVVFVGILATHRLNLWRERRNSFNLAAIQFRDAFADSLTNLERSDVTPHMVLHEFFNAHETAMRKFRPHLQDGSLRAFDESWKRYSECYRASQADGPLATLASAQSVLMQKNRAIVLACVRDLVQFAKEA